MVATSNAPSLDLRGLTQPKQNISLSPNKIGIVTLDWNAVSKVNISEQEPPTAEPPDQSLLQVRKCLEEVKSCIEKHKNAAQTAKKNVVTWSWSDCFEVHTCIKKIHNLYMCSWAFGIGLKIPKVSKTPGLHPSWSQRLKSDRPERFWVDVASLTHQGILRDLGMLPRSIEKCFHIKMERSAAQHGWHFWCQNSYISETNIAQKTFPKDLRFRAGCISMRRWWSSMVYVGVHWALASPCMCFGKRICVHSWLHAADSVHAACVHFKWEITATNNIYIYTYVDGLQPESWSGKASIQYDLSIGKDKK